MNGHPYAGVQIARTGLLDRQVVLIEGDFVKVREMWDASAPDFPMCLLPRGTAAPGFAVQREVPMYRAEAIKLGIIR
jgi:hypothetical protein